jgi:hypothetical protein
MSISKAADVSEDDLRRILSITAGIALAMIGSWWFSAEHEGDPSVNVPQGLSVEHDSGALSMQASGPQHVGDHPGAAPVAAPQNPARFLDALGSKEANWLELYKRGIQPGADPADKFSALRVLDACFPSLSNFPYPEITGAAQEEKQRIISARTVIAARCAGIGQVDLDRLKRDRVALKNKLETPASKLWQGYIGFGRSTSQTRIDAATNRLQKVFSEYGAAALYWVGPEFGNYIEISSGPFPQRVKTLDPDGRIYSASVVIAMCRATAACGQDGLTYLSMCATAEACSEDGTLGVTAGLSEIDIEYANTMAGWMIEAIRSDSWR